jgi:hypothetical protein
MQRAAGSSSSCREFERIGSCAKHTGEQRGNSAKLCTRNATQHYALSRARGAARGRADNVLELFPVAVRAEEIDLQRM